jgi:hypothetical protein
MRHPVLALASLAGSFAVTSCATDMLSPEELEQPSYVAVFPPIISADVSARGGRAAATGTVYVSSQGLYYDTFVAVDPLAMSGPFQKLESGVTEFGPGQPGYLGGRWWEDTNKNGVMDATDHYFLCPLLPPGRTSP